MSKHQTFTTAKITIGKHFTPPQPPTPTPLPPTLPANNNSNSNRLLLLLQKESMSLLEKIV